MATLVELRESYPQYSDMSDLEFADAFHNKYYNDMPKTEFYEKIGFSEAAPSKLQALKTGAKTGWGRTFGGLEQMLTGGSPELTEKMMALEEQYALSKAARPNYSMGGEFLGTAASLLPVDIAATAVVGPGGLAAAPAARIAGSQAIKRAAPTYGSKVLQGAKEVAPAAALAGGVGAGVQYLPEDSDRLTQALMGSALGAIGGAAVGGGISALSPTNISSAMTKLSPEELAIRQAAAEGTETSLGRVLDDPIMAQMQENYLSFVPLSGARSGISRTRQEMEDQAGDIFSKFYQKGENAGEVDLAKELQRKLQERYADNTAQQHQLYGARNERAEEIGAFSDKANFRKTAKNTFADIMKDKDKARNLNASLRADLESYAQPSTTPTAAGIAQREQASLTDLQTLRKDILQEANRYRMAGDEYSASIYDKLGASLSKDIDETILMADDSLLSALNKDANAFHKENILPFRQERKLRNFVFDEDLKKSDDLVRSFVTKTKGRDAADQLDLLTRNLDDEGMGILNALVFGDELGDASAKVIKETYGRLGPKQKDKLLPKGTEARGEMDQLFQLAQMNPKAFTEMFNPETGASGRIIEVIKQIAPTAGLGAGAVFAPGATAGTIGAGYGLNKILTNEKVRNAIINRAIKGKKGEVSDDKLMKAIADALKAGPRAAAVTEIVDEER